MSLPSSSYTTPVPLSSASKKSSSDIDPDCGMTHLKNEYNRDSLKEKVPEKAEEVEGMEFGEIVE